MTSKGSAADRSGPFKPAEVVKRYRSQIEGWRAAQYSYRAISDLLLEASSIRISPATLQRYVQEWAKTETK